MSIFAAENAIKVYDIISHEGVSIFWSYPIEANNEALSELLLRTVSLSFAWMVQTLYVERNGALSFRSLSDIFDSTTTQAVGTANVFFVCNFVLSYILHERIALETLATELLVSFAFIMVFRACLFRTSSPWPYR